MELTLTRRPGNRKIYDVWTVTDKNDKRTLLGRPVGVFGRVDDLEKEDYSSWRMQNASGWQWAYSAIGDVYLKVFDTYWEGRRYITRLPNLE